MVHSLWREVAKFGIVGALAFVIDMGGFNLLVGGPLAHKVTTAKIISGALATLFSWVGNRLWTFRHRRNRPVAHEVTLFFVVNGVALAVAALYLAFGHYVLGMDSRLGNNINAFIGIVLGTLLRFWAYRSIVFANEPIDEEPADADGSEPPSAERDSDAPLPRS